MRKKVIIITSSLVVLALLVVVAINAQTKTQENTADNTEQTMPDKCKACPSASKCLESEDQTAACEHKTDANCADKKCEKSATCDKAKTCDKAATCEKKAEACPEASSCKKDCPSKK
jgi:hypothetical protein